MENTVNFDYGSYMYTEVLKQHVKDYIRNIVKNTPAEEKSKIGNEKASKILEDVETFLISYSMSSNLFTVLDSKNVSLFWATLRSDEMENVFAFITHLTIQMKLTYGKHWDTLMDDLASSFDLLYESSEANKGLSPLQMEMDQDILAQLPTKSNILKLFKRNQWLVIIALITLMGSYK